MMLEYLSKMCQMTFLFLGVVLNYYAIKIEIELDAFAEQCQYFMDLNALIDTEVTVIVMMMHRS